MSLDATQTLAAIAVAAVTLVVSLYAFVRWLRPRWALAMWKRRAKDDFLVGRPATVNRITGEITPPLPSAAERMDHLADLVASSLDNRERLDNHEGRIKKLEDAAVERVVTRAESAQAFRAMEAAIKAHPDEDAEYTD